MSQHDNTDNTDNTNDTDNTDNTGSSSPQSGTHQIDTRQLDAPHADLSHDIYGSTAGATAGATTWQGVTPEFKTGPAPVTSVIGLLGLLTAIAVLVSRATDLDVPWDVVGPVAVVGAGVLLVVLGLAGLRGQRFRG